MLISDAFTDTVKRRIWKSMKITANASSFRYGAHKIYKTSLNRLQINTLIKGVYMILSTKVECI